MSVGAVWFKRDLRLEDHKPLIKALSSHEKVVLFYVFETEYWQQPFTSFRQWSFFSDCLVSLRNQILAKRGSLLIFSGTIEQALVQLDAKFGLQALYSHEETGGLWTYERDCFVRNWCQEKGIIFQEFFTNGVVRNLPTRDIWATTYQQRMQQPILSAPEDLSASACENIGITLPKVVDFPDYFPEHKTQKGGLEEGKKLLESFFSTRGLRYLLDIANPLASSSSRLSAFLAAGVFSIKQILHASKQAENNASCSWTRKNFLAFTSRLYWHCHFIQKMEDEPDIELQPMHQGFSLLSRSTCEKKLFAWKHGNTGYPFIDACMISLHSTGWLPFRLRAMLMSFASYDLWLDWRKTSCILAQLFTDYEPGIHYSQVQMQSGVTGINTLRIYNPILQSKNHDPKGLFIKKYIPCLRLIPEEWIHTPWLMPPLLRLAEGISLPKIYENPIVDHQQAIRFAKKQFTNVMEKEDFAKEAQRVYLQHGSRKKRKTRPHN